MADLLTRDNEILQEQSRADGFRKLLESANTEWGRRHFAYEIAGCERRIAMAMMRDEAESGNAPQAGAA